MSTDAVEQRMRELRERRLTDSEIDRMLLRDRVGFLEAKVAWFQEILRPLLADPIRYEDGPRGSESSCVFCDETGDQHLPSCPVLRRDELLAP